MMKPHGASLRTNALVYLALMLLLAVTYGAARLDLGRFNIVASLFIAAIKALLVGLYFMHLRRAKGAIPVAAVAGIFWLIILLSLAASDFTSRDWLMLPGHWPAGGPSRS